LAAKWSKSQTRRRGLDSAIQRDLMRSPPSTWFETAKHEGLARVTEAVFDFNKAGGRELLGDDVGR
jgi:hypothetical protein